MKSISSNIITRFPPSPTGALHIGNVRTALFNYLYAKQNNGQFIVRVEDTDKARSKKEYEEGMLLGLKWLGIEREGELLRQSERGSVYKKYLDKLIADGLAYVSEESEGENREVVRFKNPNKVIEFEDLIRGQLSFDTTELKDFIIARNVNEPIYHLAVVVDDFESGVTHVIRGEDHISNTPRQILIQEAIGAPRPVYAHLPLILAPDRSKLSKRKHGESVSLEYYRNKGYLPEALINYLALLGWNPGTDQEIFTLEDLIREFDLSKVQKGGAVFDEKKLRWINKEHLKLDSENVLSLIEKKLQTKFGETKIHPEVAQLIFERIETLADIDEVLGVGEFDYFFNKPSLEKERIAWKKSTPALAREHLMKVVELISSGGGFAEIFAYAEVVGKGEVLWPLRYALSGKEKSPDPETLMRVLGEEESLQRVKQAISLLEE